MHGANLGSPAPPGNVAAFQEPAEGDLQHRGPAIAARAAGPNGAPTQRRPVAEEAPRQAVGGGDVAHRPEASAQPESSGTLLVGGDHQPKRSVEVDGRVVAAVRVVERARNPPLRGVEHGP